MPRQSQFERNQGATSGQQLPAARAAEKVRRHTGQVGVAETEIFFAVCPVCGKSSQSHQLDFARPREAFGVVMGTRGRGTMRKVRDLDPEGDPELFEKVKAHLQAAVREWKAKGWI